eukprot:SAG22_NODE_2186_length_2867_cov_5.854408_2_plen_270_part_00
MGRARQACFADSSDAMADVSSAQYSRLHPGDGGDLGGGGGGGGGLSGGDRLAAAMGRNGSSPMSDSLLRAAEEPNSVLDVMMDSPFSSGAAGQLSHAGTADGAARRRAISSLRSSPRPLLTLQGRESSAPVIYSGMKAAADAGAAPFESLDYDKVCSQFWLRGQYKMLESGRKFYGYSGATAGRWIITFGIGLLIGVVAFTMGLSIELLLEAKLDWISADVAKYADAPHVVLLRFIGYNLGLVLVAAGLVIFFAPEAASSGIPEVIGEL